MKDWVKVVVCWLASIGGWLAQNVTLGRAVLIATLILTLLQIWRTWLDISFKWRRNADRI